MRTTRSGSSTTSPGSGRGRSISGTTSAKQQAEQQRGRERLAETAVVLAAARPRHDELAGRKLAELTLDDPIELAQLFLFLCLEEIVLEHTGLVFLLRDFLNQHLSPVLDHAHPLPEGFHAPACAAHVLLACGRRAVAPEELGAAGLAELIERTARVAQQPVLPALGAQAFELGVDCAQVTDETVELLACLGELREERLAVL